MYDDDDDDEDSAKQFTVSDVTAQLAGDDLAQSEVIPAAEQTVEPPPATDAVTAQPATAEQPDGGPSETVDNADNKAEPSETVDNVDNKGELSEKVDNVDKAEPSETVDNVDNKGEPSETVDNADNKKMTESQSKPEGEELDKSTTQLITESEKEDDRPEIVEKEISHISDQVDKAPE